MSPKLASLAAPLIAAALFAGTHGRAEAADKEKPRLPAGDRGKPATAGRPASPRRQRPRPADETPDGKRRLAGGQVEFVPPAKADWDESVKNRTATRNAFVSTDRKAMLVVEVLPPDQQITAAVGPAMVKRLREVRAKSGEKPTRDPAVEKDERFVVRVRERITAADGTAGEQLHLYRAVGSRFVYTLCKTFGGDAAAGHLKAAEGACLSAVPAGGGAGQKPVPTTKPGTPAKPGTPGKPGKPGTPGSRLGRGRSQRSRQRGKIGGFRWHGMYSCPCPPPTGDTGMSTCPCHPELGRTDPDMHAYGPVLPMRRPVHFNRYNA
jgi:hypothetical protein